jgi:uncharacterized membrane protein
VQKSGSSFARADGQSTKARAFIASSNEVPTAILILIVFLVVLKPF